MNLFINVVLLLTGTALAAVSYFGKPSEKVEGLRRITTRHGAASLMLWLIVLSFGIWKEKRTERKDDDSARAAVKVQIEASDARTETKQKENELRREAELANARLADLKNQLADVNGSLSRAQAAEKEANSANLVSSLSNSDQPVQVLSFWMPFTRKAHATKNQVRAFLPQFKNPVCEDLVGLIVILDPDLGLSLSIPYTPDDTAAVVTGPGYKKEYVSAIDAISGQEGLKSIADYLGQRSRNGMYYEVDTNEDFLVQSSSVLFTSLNAEHSQPVTISSSFPAWTYGADVDAKYKRRYQQAGLPTMPKACSDQIGSYFASVFDKGAIMFATHQQHPEYILFPLHHLPPHKAKDGNWSVTFEVSGPARFGAGLSLPSSLIGSSQVTPALQR